MALAAAISPAEFLAQERRAEMKHELLGGVVTEMPAGSFAHSALKVALIVMLSAQKRQAGFRVLDSDVRVRIPGDGYVYPDATLVVDAQLEDSEKDVLLNPVAIFEVLSPSTESRDRKDKFDAYTTVPSVREYVLISSTERPIEVFRRDRDVWLYSVYRDGDTALVGDGRIGLPLTDLYDEVPL
ncbi:Uma2 family endonuclease [bacterium]|nr:MAG: Uma2 family endonuclease [bacterium]